MGAEPFTIILPGEPHAQGRPRFRQWRAKDGRSGVVAYDPAESRSWKATAQEHFADALTRAGLKPPLIGGGPIELIVLAAFTCPQSQHRATRPRPRRWHAKRPDADNLLKAIKDAARGVLFLDDAQVSIVSIAKIIAAQGEAPFVQVTLRAIAEAEAEIAMRQEALPLFAGALR